MEFPGLGAVRRDHEVIGAGFVDLEPGRRRALELDLHGHPARAELIHRGDHDDLGDPEGLPAFVAESLVEMGVPGCMRQAC